MRVLSVAGGTKRRRARIVLGALFGLLALAPSAMGHAYLASATPGPGESVPEGTSVLALRFTEQIDASESNVELRGPDGQTVPVETEVPASRSDELRVLTEPLPQGAYELSWRVLSVDGHVEEGTMGFEVGPEGDGFALFEDASGEPPGGPEVIEGLSRMLLFGGVLAAVGLPLFVAEVAKLEAIPDRFPLALVLLLGGSVIGLAGLFVLLTSSLETSFVEALQTRAGGILLAQAALVLAALGLAGAALRRGPEHRSMPLRTTALPAGLAIVVHSMGGHGVLAFASREAVAGHVAATLHVLVVGLWLGGLMGFLLVRGTSGPQMAALVERFFPIGILSVVALAATGLYQAYVHLPQLADLWQSPYGWILMGKTILLAVLAGFGAVHQQWSRPLLAGGRDMLDRFGRLVGSELAVLLLVVALAGVLASAPLPSAPLDEGPGPAATLERQNQTEDFTVRIAFANATLQAGEEHRVEVDLQPRTSLRPEDVDLGASLQPPGVENESRSILANSSGDGRWTLENVHLDQEGHWGLTVRLHTQVGVQQVGFRFPVLGPAG